MDYKLYLSLYYLNKGKYNIFYSLLDTSEKEIKDNLGINKKLDLLIQYKYIEYKQSNLIIITPKGLDLISKHGDLLNSNKKNDKIGSEEKIDENFINQFLKGYPSHRIGKISDLTRELKFFYNEYGYSKKVILQAKEEYLKKEAENNYMYIKKTTNFILSDLDTYCRYIILNVKDEETDNQTSILL